MAKLSPYPIFRAFDSNGAPLAGGKLYSFDAGTSTPRATFTDQGGGTPNANPVILDANGEAEVWLDGNYKLQLDDASDVTQWTVDNIEQFATTINETLSPSAGANAFQLTVSGTINEAASGTHTLLGGVRIDPPTINGDAASVTEVPTLYISSAPSAVGATPYALHVDAGATQLDGTLTVGGATVLTTVTSGDIAIEGSDATLTVKDTDGVFGTAIPKVEFQDSAGTVGGSLAFDVNQDMLLTNSIAEKNIELHPTGDGFIFLNGDVVVTPGPGTGLRADLILRDTQSAGIEATHFIQGQDSASVQQWTLGSDVPTNSSVGLTASVVGEPIYLRTFGGKNILRDGLGVWGVATPHLEFQDSALTVGATFTVNAAQELVIDHGISAKPIVMSTTGSGGILRIDGEKQGLVIRDTTTSVLADVVASLTFEANDSSNVAHVSVQSATDPHFTVENLVSTGDLELKTNGGTVVLGTSGSGPAIRVGTGVPSDSDPNGSLFLRTDGGAGTTLYVRHGGTTWTPLT